MATSARIEELKQKFDENPRRYFAPLANELRKLGDLSQAITICRTHLANQPAHVSGHIVLAQALYEIGEFDDASTEFGSALSLDPENLIALRYMGDIALARGESLSARAWYERVLDADPRNHEIAQLLRELDAVPNESAPPAETLASLAAHATPDMSQAAQPEQEFAEQHVERPAPESASTTPTELDTMWDAAPLSSVSDHEAAPQDWFGEDERASHEAEHESDLDATPEKDAASVVSDDIESLFVSAESRYRPIGDEMESAAARQDGDSTPDALDADQRDHAIGREAIGTGARYAGEGSPGESRRTLSDQPIGRTPTVVQAVPEPAPTPFVTETLAELYVQQGFRDEALSIYRQLLMRNPSDDALRDRVSALESGSVALETPQSAARGAENAKAAQSVRTFFGRLARRQRSRLDRPSRGGSQSTMGEKAPSPDPGATPDRSNEQSILTQLFAATEASPEDAAAAESLATAFDGSDTAGRPSRVAERELSLDHLFREGTPEAPADVTLDDFYAATDEGADTSDNTDADSENSDERASEIRQFTSWLDGLKKK